jgi:hypothetical protein
MNKALYFLTIPILLSPLAAAEADPSDWYLGGAVVYTDDDPKRRLDDMIGGGQFNVGRRLTDVFALEGRTGRRCRIEKARNSWTSASTS